MGQVGHYQSRNSYLSQIASRIGLEKLEPDLNFFFYKYEGTYRRNSEDFCSDKSVFLMIIGIGASSYAMRCSVTVDTQDLATQREIASAIQGNSTSGLKDLWMDDHFSSQCENQTNLWCGKL